MTIILGSCKILIITECALKNSHHQKCKTPIMILSKHTLYVVALQSPKQILQDVHPALSISKTRISRV